MNLYDVLQVKNALVKCVYYVKNYKICNPSATMFSATERIIPAVVLMRVMMPKYSKQKKGFKKCWSLRGLKYALL
jgi:hypothetical protein